MQKFLLILEVSQKQNYIFASNKLRENVQRSQDIADVTSSAFFKQAAPELYDEKANMVYSGGGHTVLQFDAETAEAAKEAAVAFASRVTGEVFRRYNGLELFVKTLLYDEQKTPGANLLELSAALERKKSQRLASFRRQSFGVEALAQQPPAAKRRAAAADPFAALAPAGCSFSARTDVIAAKMADNFVAVVHIDGNAMGKRVDTIYQQAGADWDACCAALRAFSQNIQQSFENAFRRMAERVAEFCPADKELPLRPLILAGDDVYFVAGAPIALECSRIFLEELARQKPFGGQPPYAACAGVAVVHTKFPFHTAYDLAEELCSSAKKFGSALDADGRVSAMDWHIEYGQMKDNLAELRDDYIAQDGSRIDLRPVAVLTPAGCRPGWRDYAVVRELCKALQKSGGAVARGKLKVLRSALKQGRVESEFYLKNASLTKPLQKAVRRALAAAGLTVTDELFRDLFLTIDGEARCFIFDSIEMMDHFVAFEEVRG